MILVSANCFAHKKHLVSGYPRFLVQAAFPFSQSGKSWLCYTCKCSMSMVQYGSCLKVVNKWRICFIEVEGMTELTDDIVKPYKCCHTTTFYCWYSLCCWDVLLLYLREEVASHEALLLWLSLIVLSFKRHTHCIAYIIIIL